MNFLLKILNFIWSYKPPVLSDEERTTLAIKYNDSGKFNYEEDGFVFDSQQKIKWSEIEQLIAYKQDLLTFDEICIDVVCNGKYQTFSEGTPGWHQFVEKIKLALPSIPDNWEGKILYPAFKTNLTILYQRDPNGPQ